MGGEKRMIYVAGKFSDKETARTTMDVFEQLGWTITRDWTGQEETHKDPANLGVQAKLDLEGVANAHILVVTLLDPVYSYRGTYTEVGAALALGRKVYFVEGGCTRGAFFRTNCFYHHPAIVHYTWGGNRDQLVNIARRISCECGNVPCNFCQKIKEQ